MSNEKNDDVEAPLLYPSMQESPELRWAFIRKVYSILAVQILATIAVAAGVAANPPVAIFFRTTWGGWAAYVAILIAVITVMVLLAVYQNKHPVNFLLLAMFTVFLGFLVGLTASFVSPTIIIEAATATIVVVVTLTVYTFWAARRGEDFGFLIPFLLTFLLTLILFIVYMIFFPVGKISYMLYSGLFVVIFSIYIIFDTNELIKRNTYDQYISASVAIYLDVIRIFLRLLRIFKAANRR